jgi:hypothetical protein
MNPITSFTLSAAASTTQQSANGGKRGWFEAMAQAWGQALDKQAQDIEIKSDAINAGNDTPGAIVDLTAQAQRMGFVANSAHTAIAAVGQALETMARKQ